MFRLSSELLISFESQGLRTRRLIGRFASDMGFKHERIRELDVCANELISNLVRQRTRSAILGIKGFVENGIRGIELKAPIGRDENQKEWVQRLSDLKRRAAAGVQIESNKEECSVRVKKHLSDRDMIEGRGEDGPGVAVCNHPAPFSQRESFVVHEEGSRILLGLIEGGVNDNEAGETASLVELFLYKNNKKPLERILHELKGILAHSVNTEVSLVRIDERDGQMQFAAIGSLTARLWNPDEYRWVDLVGVDGVNAVSFRMSYDWMKGSILVMQSKDIPEDWQIPPSLHLLPAQDIANYLIIRKRGLAEATVMVVK